VSPVTDVTIGGLPARHLKVNGPAASDECSDTIWTWATSTRINGIGAGELDELRIVDPHGVRVLFVTGHFPAVITEAQLAELQQIVESVDFE
jgi:hypothetical protein